jgi:hypothetical protein
MENGEYGKLCVFAPLRLCVDVAGVLRLVAGGVVLAQGFGLDDDVSHSVFSTRMHTENTDFFL